MARKLKLEDIRSLGASQFIQSFFIDRKPAILKEDDGTYSIHSHLSLKGLSEAEALQALTELSNDYEF